MIQESYVRFEIAKLLKEKGFDWECISYYVDYEPKDVKYSFLGETNSVWENRCYSAPTLQMTMRWLREVHKVHIVAEPCLGEGNEPNLSFNRWFWTVLEEEGEYKPIRKIDEFPTYEQACEAAIKYCLENLI